MAGHRKGGVLQPSASKANAAMTKLKTTSKPGRRAPVIKGKSPSPTSKVAGWLNGVEEPEVASYVDEESTEAPRQPAAKSPLNTATADKRTAAPRDSASASSDISDSVDNAALAQPKSRKIVLDKNRTSTLLVPKARNNKTNTNIPDLETGYIGQRKVGDPGVAIVRINKKLMNLDDPKESRRLWWEQTDAFAYRWGDSDESNDDMEWANEYLPKTHWKTRKALAARKAQEEEAMEQPKRKKRRV